VKTENGTCLISNHLSQVCDFNSSLRDKKAQHAIALKPDTLIFNLFLDAYDNIGQTSGTTFHMTCENNVDQNLCWNN